MDLLRTLRQRWILRLGMCLWLLMPFALKAQSSPSSTPLVLPSGIAFDSQGDLYLAEKGNHVVRRVDRVGGMAIVAGTGTQGYGGDLGLAKAALLDSPQGVAIGAGGLYIADTHNHRVRRVDLSSGIITTVAGGSTAGSGGDHGPADAAQLDRPVALALDAKGDLFIADTGSHRVRRVDATTNIITTVAGAGTQGYDGDGGQAGSALLDSPQGLAVDTAGNLYLADTHNHRVRRIDASTGTITTVAGTGVFGYAGDLGSATSAKLALPQGLSIDAEGNIYIADAANHRVRRIDAATGAMTTVAGDGTQGFTGDGGAAASAALDSPRATTLSPDGLVTFADTGNQRVRQVDAGAIQTIAGSGAATPETLSIMGDASVSYGSGQLTAMLAASSAGGTVTFSDQYGGVQSTVATVPLSSNAAIFDTSQLSVGQHVIMASYSGDSSHVAVVSGAFSLTVTKARTATSLAVTTATLVSASSVGAGQPVLMTAHVASATKGVPTGTLILFDGGTLLNAGAATASGDLTLTTSALGVGPHSLTAAYSGDGNFEASTSPTTLFTVSTPAPGPADFTLAPGGVTTQTIVSGNSADFSFTVQVNGDLSSPISLAASGLPELATASFNPGSITPGTSSATFTMTVATPKTAKLDGRGSLVVFAALIGVVALAGRGQKNIDSKMLFVLLFSTSLLVLAGCGDRIRTGDSAAGPPKSYTITVTGTATDPAGTLLHHTATVTLVLQPPS